MVSGSIAGEKRGRNVSREKICFWKTIIEEKQQQKKLKSASESVFEGKFKESSNNS